MENLENFEPPMVDPQGNGDSGTMESSSVELSAQPDMVDADMGTTEAVVPPKGTGVVGDDREGEKEGREAAVGGGDGVGDAGGSKGDGDDGEGGGGEVSVGKAEKIVMEETPVEETPVIPMRSGEPKGKGIVMEEPVVTPGPMGLTASDCAVVARQVDVMEQAQKNPGVLDAVCEEMREAEVVRAQVAAEVERDAAIWARELEEEKEEGEDEVEGWI